MTTTVRSRPRFYRDVRILTWAFQLLVFAVVAAVVERDGTRHRTLAGLLALFAGFALGLAVLGLYSSLAYVVAQRRHEIAIRVAIGASPRGVARLVLGEGVPVVVAGVVAGAVLSPGLSRLLATQLYGVSPTDPLTFIAIAILLAVTATGAILLPVRQAVRVQPAATLRVE